MKKFLYLLLLPLLFATCRKDNGERIFELVYPNITFEIPAGLSSSFPWVWEFDGMQSNIDFYLREHSVDTAVITAISPFSARLTSLDNSDYDFIREISVRICEDGAAECSPADEVFYIDRLAGRAGDRVELLPGLRNAKRVLTAQTFRLEIVFFFDFNTPFSTSNRLDLVFEAVK